MSYRTPSQITSTVAEYFDVKWAELMGDVKSHSVARARMISMYLCRELTTDSLYDIGRFFGRKHSSVLRAIRRVRVELEYEERMQMQVKEMLELNRNEEMFEPIGHA